MCVVCGADRDWGLGYLTLWLFTCVFIGNGNGNGDGDGDVFPVGCMTLPGPWAPQEREMVDGSGLLKHTTRSELEAVFSVALFRILEGTGDER